MKEGEAARVVLLELDVDLAVSPKAIGGNAYSSIRERLTQLGDTMQESPARFFKHLPDLAHPIKVHRISRAGIGREALELLRLKFRTFDSVGPVRAGWAAATAGDDAKQFQRAAFEDSAELFRLLDAT